ncbi:MAG: zinc-binding dehydrogenase, partial [Myxococcota bacterium]
VAVCSAKNAELVRSLGADYVVDYTAERVSDRRGFDAVFDIFGTLPWPVALPMLVPRGRFCTAIPRLGAVGRGLLRKVGLHRAALVVVQSRRRDLEQLARWVEEKRLRPVVDRVWALEASAEAHAYIETRRARGKVVLEIRNAG